jgi:cell division protein FtsQ
MSSTIKRGPPPRRPVVKRKARKPKRSMIDRILGVLPVSEHTLRRIVSWTLTGAVLAAMIGVAAWFGIPGAIGTTMAEGVGAAGFKVDEIEVTGAEHMDPMTVYAVALDQKSRAMPLVDLAGVREKLLSYGWIKDARVSRRLPNKLLIDIVVRKPSAVWQDHGTLTLIAADGVPLGPVAAEDMPNLPLLIGPGADQEEVAYQQLLDAAPALRPRVKAATWVGNRRWDILFDSGETLALPAGDDDAAKALVAFAELVGRQRLLGKGWVRFDLRNPDKLVARKRDGQQISPTGLPGTTPGAAASNGASAPNNNTTGQQTAFAAAEQG